MRESNREFMRDGLNGIIVLNKPKGKTSHDMVYFCRRLLGIKRVGHTGTLDPDAEGVLPMCIGNATKAAELITATDKEYEAELVLGKTTDTLDVSGNVLSETEVNLGEDEIRRAIMSFVGEYAQTPPMYSAIKQNGKKLYELAREGKTVYREPRTVKINSIEILKMNPVPILRISCSKGTYIRSLCADIGERLGVGGCMGALTRIRTGQFKISDSFKCGELTELFENGRISEALIPVDRVFSEYPELHLNEKQTKSVCNGVIMICRQPDGLYRVYDNNNAFICIGRVSDEKIKTEKSFWM